MIVFEVLLITSLIICAISAFFSKRLLVAVIIYMAYSLIMTIIWALLQSPDLAITEAAVGAGVTGILFVLTLRKIHALKGTKDE
ncbi:MAG: hydrogenase subunit MbhD domain-containing protein [Clostridia bacterium]